MSKRGSFVAVLMMGLVGCGQDAGDANANPGDEQDVNKAAVSTIECTVGKGVQDHDDVAKLAFKMTGLGSAKTTFVKTGWAVSDKAGKALTPDGDAMSVVAEGFDAGVDIKQCKNDAKKGLVCGALVLSLDNESSEMPVTISLTKKSGYKAGTLTIDNTINTGDNSGYLHAPLTCTINGK